MVHLVLKRKRYWELQESYRDERGRPRKRFVRYLGVLGQIDWKAAFAPGDGVDWHAIEQQELARIKAEEKAYQEKLAKLPQGMRLGPTDPVPVEKPSSTIELSASVEPSRSEPAPPSEPEPSAPEESQLEQPAEPDADADPSPDSE